MHLFQIRNHVETGGRTNTQVTQKPVRRVSQHFSQPKEEAKSPPKDDAMSHMRRRFSQVV